jgi:Uncharacterised nucleotidyltransferase
MPSSLTAESPDLQRALLALLRRAHPAADAPSATIQAMLRMYECGGYLHALWASGGRLNSLPPAWAEALRSAYRKTTLDNLAALAEFRVVGGILNRAGIAFILLKGASYLTNLYDDPGARMLTDIDLLIHPADAGRVGHLMMASEFRGLGEGYESRFQRFEMRRTTIGGCGFEFHWRIGLPLRFRVKQDEIWRRAVPCTLEGVPTLRLDAEDAVLYHVAHLADHYYGPSLKWIIDLREMFQRWGLNTGELRTRSITWRVRTALQLALMHLEKLFPDDPGPQGIVRESRGRSHWRSFDAYLSKEPLALLDVPGQKTVARYVLRLLLVDRLSDAAALVAAGTLRPLVQRVARALGHERPPWEWR